MHPLVVESMKKAAIVWIGVGEAAPFPAWCVWSNEALYIVSGPGEQPATGLASATAATVTARGDHGGRIVTWPARVDRLSSADESWSAIATEMAGKRLNSDAAEVLVARWANECVISRLTPADAPVAAGASLPTGALAAPVAPSPAVRATRKPFKLHRVRQPKR